MDVPLFSCIISTCPCTTTSRACNVLHLKLALRGIPSRWAHPTAHWACAFRTMDHLLSVSGQSPQICGEGPSMRSSALRSSSRTLVRTLSTWDQTPSYATHVPLSPASRALLSVGAAVGALASPARADLVATLGETTGRTTFERLRGRMKSCESGRKLLQERPLLNSSVLERCRSLPEGTFGRSYASFMQQRGFDADARPPVRFLDDEELAYVALRVRQVHDLWHVLFGCGTNALGELALKAFEFSHTGLPMAFLSVAGAQVRLSRSQRRRLFTEYVPWALVAGRRAVDLVPLAYEDHLHQDLASLRQQWRITPSPSGTEHR